LTVTQPDPTPIRQYTRRARIAQSSALPTIADEPASHAAAERISNDSDEIARVLTFMDAATVLAGGIDVPTGSGSIPTAGPPAMIISTGSEVCPTASLIVTKRKGKEVMVEF
nr:hypothetical protein [Tanacetum cinerariifolium]